MTGYIFPRGLGGQCMTVPIKAGNHLSFAPMQTLYNLISANIQDLNVERKNKATASERQWIYPSVPEANDENYPRIALLNDNIRFEEYGAARYIRMERDGLGNAEKMVFGRVAVLPVTIAVFVKKLQRHEATFYDGVDHAIKNTKQADYLGEKIEKYMLMLREQYFIPYGMDIEVKSVSRTYSDNDFLYAKNISVEILLFDEWNFDFTDPAYNEGIIQNVDLTVTVV